MWHLLLGWVYRSGCTNIDSDLNMWFSYVMRNWLASAIYRKMKLTNFTRNSRKWLMNSLDWTFHIVIKLSMWICAAQDLAQRWDNISTVEFKRLFIIINSSHCLVIRKNEVEPLNLQSWLQEKGWCSLLRYLSLRNWTKR